MKWNQSTNLHGKTDELGLVEILGQVTRFNGVDGAHSDEEEIETERSDQTPRRRVADDENAWTRREKFDGVGRFQYEHGNNQDDFNANHGHCD